MKIPWLARMFAALAVKFDGVSPLQIDVYKRNTEQCQRDIKKLKNDYDYAVELRINDRDLFNQQLHQVRELAYCMVRNLYRYGVPRDRALDFSLDDHVEATNVELQKMWGRAVSEIDGLRVKNAGRADQWPPEVIAEMQKPLPLDERRRLEKLLDNPVKPYMTLEGHRE